MAIKKMIVWAGNAAVYYGPFVVDVDFGDVEASYNDETGEYVNLIGAASVMSEWGRSYDLYTNFKWINPPDVEESGYYMNDLGGLELLRDTFLPYGISPSWAFYNNGTGIDYEDDSVRIYYNRFIGDYNDPKYTGGFGEYFPEDWEFVNLYSSLEFTPEYELRSNNGSGEVIKPKFTND